MQINKKTCLFPYLHHGIYICMMYFGCLAYSPAHTTQDWCFRNSFCALAADEPQTNCGSCCIFLTIFSNNFPGSKSSDQLNLMIRFIRTNLTKPPSYRGLEITHRPVKMTGSALLGRSVYISETRNPNHANFCTQLEQHNIGKVIKG